jgi:hypothetical protein
MILQVEDDLGAVNEAPAGYGASANKPYDLAERTALFGEAVIDFLKKVPVNPITRRLIEQL